MSSLGKGSIEEVDNATNKVSLKNNRSKKKTQRETKIQQNPLIIATRSATNIK